jgi:hypothetical protein
MLRTSPARCMVASRSVSAGVLLAAPLLAFTATAHAQQVATISEAAQINGGLALQLCITPGVQGPQRAEMFRQAGFSDRVERSTVNSDTTHDFTDPSQSVRIELYYGEMPEHCFVTSDHMGVSIASGVLDQVVPRVHPGYVRRVEAGPPDPETGQPAQCVRYEDPTNPIGEVIGVIPGDGAAGCIGNGTSRFYSSSRV